jgi:hypothetical protein
MKVRHISILVIALLIADQILKIWVKTNFHLGEAIVVIPNWFQLLFVENNGAAFGMQITSAGSFDWGKLALSLFRIVLVGGLHPALFWLGFAPFSLMGTITRPFSTNIMLDQQDGDSGSAASLIGGVATVFGSIGMVAASLFSNAVFGLGFIIFLSGAASLIGWFALMKSSLPLKGVK